MNKLNPINSQTTADLIKAAIENQLIPQSLSSEHRLIVLKNKKNNYYLLRHILELNSYVSYFILQDKALVKKILIKNKIPIAKDIKANSYREVLAALKKNKINFPLVIKPIDGSQGKGVTVDINNSQYLKKAVNAVNQFNLKKHGKKTTFLVEKYIPGSDYRFIVLDHTVLTVLRREPAYIVGDGKKNIQQLITKYNSSKNIGKYKPLCPILVDYALQQSLREQTISLKTIPPINKKIYLRKNANISTGGRSFECTKEVNLKYKKMAVKISKLLRVRFCSVDLIALDIKKFKDFAIIEINNDPVFDINEHPYQGKPFPISNSLIKALLKN